MSITRLKNLVNKYIENSKQTNVPVTYTRSSTYNDDDCSISFYEWSNIESEPRKFNSKKAFLSFLKECNIPEQNMENELKYTYTSHITCLKGTTKLVRGISKYDLNYEYNRKIKITNSTN